MVLGRRCGTPDGFVPAAPAGRQEFRPSLDIPPGAKSRNGRFLTCARGLCLRRRFSFARLM